MQRYSQNRLSVVGTKRWKDADGNWRTKTRRFTQSLNPFNATKGTGKTREQVLEELRERRDAWMNEAPGAGQEGAKDADE